MEILLKKINKVITKKNIEDNINFLDSDIVYLGGSLIEGEVNEISKNIGNKYSDLDVFVIRKEGYDETKAIYNNKLKKTFFKKINNINVDIEIYDIKILNSLINSVNNIKLSKDNKISNSLYLDYDISENEINDFLGRLKNSICIKNKQKYEEIKESIKFSSWINFQKEIILNDIENKEEDILGALSENQIDVALYSLRLRYYAFMKYILLLNNEIIDRDKWISLKIKNLIQKKKEYEVIYEEYKNIFLMDMTDFNEAEKKINSNIKFVIKKIEEEFLKEVNFEF